MSRLLVRIQVIAGVVLLSACTAIPQKEVASSAQAVPPPAATERNTLVSTAPKVSRPTAKVPVLPMAKQTEVSPDNTKIVFFQPASIKLSTMAKDTIHNIAQELNSNRRLKVTLSGQTENLGSEELCLSISAILTEEVEDELVGQGVKSLQIFKRPRGCATALNNSCRLGACPSPGRTVKLLLNDNS